MQIQWTEVRVNCHKTAIPMKVVCLISLALCMREIDYGKSHKSKVKQSRMVQYSMLRNVLEVLSLRSSIKNSLIFSLVHFFRTLVSLHLYSRVKEIFR